MSDVSSLPVIDRPIYKTNILSLKNPVEFVPFTVKESKILMMAREGKELESMVDGLRQVLRNCLVDKSIDVNNLAMVDLEWLFVNLQARSFGEVMPLFFKCTNKVNGVECDMVIEEKLNLLTVDVSNKDVERRIALSETTGLQMRFPTYAALQASVSADDNEQDIILAANCVEYVYDKQSIVEFSKLAAAERVAFIEQLPIDKYEMIEKFLQNCPVLTKTIEKKCEKCGFEYRERLEGLEDFFV